MKEPLFLDTETYSTIKITDGTYRYSEAVEVMIITYAIGDGPVQLWDRTANPETTSPPMPADLRAALNDPEVEIVGHNIGGFDRVVIEKDLGITIPSERTHDTFARAYAHSMPGSLDTLCTIFNVPVAKAKDKGGKKLIQLFCKPRNDGNRATKLTHPEEWVKFCAYAVLDIEAMRYLYQKMPNWNYIGFEKTLWNLDQKINKRGFAIDLDLIESAIRGVDEAQVGHKARVVELTEGEVSSATRRDMLLKYVLKTYDIDLPDMQAATLERRIEDPNIPEGLRELLRIRLMACTSSTAKYKKILACVSSDGRLRGTIQWCGAGHTGRDCLAEGTLILVKTIENIILEKPIENVLLSDRTWDGDEWVVHEGVVFSGDKCVIEHDEVVATTEHNVYISTTEYVSLKVAKIKNIKLWRGNHDVQNLSDNISKWT